MESANRPRERRLERHSRQWTYRLEPLVALGGSQSAGRSTRVTSMPSSSIAETCYGLLQSRIRLTMDEFDSLYEAVDLVYEIARFFK